MLVEVIPFLFKSITKGSLTGGGKSFSGLSSLSSSLIVPVAIPVSTTCKLSDALVLFILTSNSISSFSLVFPSHLCM